jgi:hypothetical protein
MHENVAGFISGTPLTSLRFGDLCVKRTLVVVRYQVVILWKNVLLTLSLKKSFLCKSAMSRHRQANCV